MGDVPDAGAVLRVESGGDRSGRSTSRAGQHRRITVTNATTTARLDAESQQGAQREPVTPDLIMQTAMGFMAAKHLFAANDLGLFEALGQGPANLDELAARTSVPRRTLRITVDAMVALGFVTRDADAYRNGPVAATFLAGRMPADLRPFLRFWDRISYPAWGHLAEALRTDTPIPTELDAGNRDVFLAGVEAITAGAAQALTSSYDFSGHKRLLDIGGGSGSISCAIASRYPEIEATIFDLPGVVPMSRESVAAAGFADRITTVAGDVLEDAYPGDHDVVLLANVVHYFDGDRNRAVLRRSRDAVTEGGRLLALDFWTDSGHTEPVGAALMAGEFAVQLGGDVYSVDEFRAWLEATGWRYVEHRPLAGPFSLVVAEAT
jgi:SAM-dependent methyltransferase/predicted transcriptional regulator